jgi:hypothetical protein
MTGLFFFFRGYIKKIASVKKVDNNITIDECKKFHPNQWVKLYGVFSNRCDYITTCQVYQLEIVVNGNQRHWWDGYLLEPVNEEEQPISVEEAFELRKSVKLSGSKFSTSVVDSPRF